MKLAPVRPVLATSVRGAQFNGLANIPPRSVKRRKPVGAVDRAQQARRLRGLSDKQKFVFDGLLGKAEERIQEEAKNRQTKWLRRLDCISRAGYRTYQQKWDTLARIAGPLLARLDLSTMVLGYYKDGEYRLNRQRGLSEDSGVNEWTLSRLLTDLEAAKYIRRKQRRIFHNGKQWITRTTINVRAQFFIDLGLGHLLAEARSVLKAKLKTAVKKHAATVKAEALADQASAQERKASHNNAQRARREQEQSAKAAADEAYKIDYGRAWASFLLETGLRGNAASVEFVRRYPHFKTNPIHR